ncbi:MAG: hypothetical protein QM652_08365 [Legionella sp.]
MNRLFTNIYHLMREANAIHLANYKSSNTNEIDSNYITRLSTNEFFFYTQEPLTLKEFEALQNKIATEARILPAGIQLAFSSFAVKNDNNQVMSVTPHITCGKPPSFHFIVKNYTSAIDVRYKEKDINGNFKTLEVFDATMKPLPVMPQIKIDGIFHTFTFNNVLPCKTPEGEPFLTAIDICLDHSYGVARLHVEELVKSSPAIISQSISHMVLSNCVDLKVKNCLGTVMQVDPINSPLQCKNNVTQVVKGTGPQCFFGNKEVNIYELSQTPCETLQEVSCIKQLRQDMQKFNFLKHSLQQLKFGPQDKLMDQFIEEQEKTFNIARKSKQRQQLLKQLQQTVNRLEADAATKEIKTVIADLRKNAGLFTVGMNGKADRIENAMHKVSIEDRCHFLQSASFKEVMKTLASHRHLGKKEEVYLTENSNIDVNKAAATFKNFKEKFSEAFKDEEKKQSEKITSVIAPKS